MSSISQHCMAFNAGSLSVYYYVKRPHTYVYGIKIEATLVVFGSLNSAIPGGNKLRRGSEAVRITPASMAVGTPSYLFMVESFVGIGGFPRGDWLIYTMMHLIVYDSGWENFSRLSGSRPPKAAKLLKSSNLTDFKEANQTAVTLQKHHSFEGIEFDAL